METEKSFSPVNHLHFPQPNTLHLFEWEKKCTANILHGNCTVSKGPHPTIRWDYQTDIHYSRKTIRLQFWVRIPGQACRDSWWTFDEMIQTSSLMTVNRKISKTPTSTQMNHIFLITTHETFNQVILHSPFTKITQGKKLYMICIFTTWSTNYIYSTHLLLYITLLLSHSCTRVPF